MDQRLTRETSGVGLGLSIVELIARAHRGAVTVRSESGTGSTFMLRLPRASGGGVSERACSLIEDEPALARGLSDTLRARGFDVEVADDGEPASTPR